jgi:hypothetical protein
MPATCSAPACYLPDEEHQTGGKLHRKGSAVGYSDTHLQHLPSTLPASRRGRRQAGALSLKLQALVFLYYVSTLALIIAYLLVSHRFSFPRDLRSNTHLL